MSLSEELLKPIAGENPSGASLRYEPVYDQIKEAAREDDDLVQGVWQHERKIADWPRVLKLARDALAKQSKDLQLAAWLTEAKTHLEGFAGFIEGTEILRGLLEQFWDTIYPELEDGDAEMRSVPLMYVASKLEVPLRRAALTKDGLDWIQYKESTVVPTEEDSSSDENKMKIRSLAIVDGKTTPEDVAESLKRTPAAFFDECSGQLDGCVKAIGELDDLCNERFEDYAPNFRPIKDTLAELANTVRILKQRKDDAGGTPAQPAARPRRAAASDPMASSDPFGDPASGADPFGDPAPAPAADPYADTGEDPFAVEAIETGDAFAAETEAAIAPSADAFAPASQQGAAVEQPAWGGGGGYALEPSDASDCGQRIASAAEWLRKQDPANPSSYLLLRGYRWGELRSSGATLSWSLMVAAPLEVRQTLKRLSLEPDWEKLLEESERAMASEAGRGWLDVQRYTLLALENLGEEYQRVAAAVRGEVKALLEEYPDLLSASMDDDTPAASAQTKEFLSSLGLLPDESRTPAPVAAKPTTEELVKEALKKGRHEIALEIVARQMKIETSGRARFQWKSEQASILMEAGRAAVAFPILKELTAEIFERRLEDWEPASVVVEPLMLYYRCLTEVQQDGEEKQRIYAAVCRLDPVRAFELS